jgi:hypothetical protein
VVRDILNAAGVTGTAADVLRTPEIAGGNERRQAA